MLKLQNSFLHLLNEAVNRQTITDSINQKSICVIYYAGDETINKGYREIEPVAYGTTIAGNEAVRAWQIRGASDTPDNLPGWRLFRVDRIVNWTKTFSTYTQPRPNYNQNGDDTMAQVFLNAQFSQYNQPDREQYLQSPIDYNDI